MCFNYISLFLLKIYVLISVLDFSCSSNIFIPNRIKRADIDLQTCIDNFDIHRDKIIRTQDSQKMGAKYLNEIDLGTREECLRLCCETENCDVFVFEEKNSGSCYLFHCGPPEDFKCKFTHHVNYSSAVLAINRHLPDLESQIKLTKHEQDLNKLRKPDSGSEIIPADMEQQTIPSTAIFTTTSKSKDFISPNTKTKPPEEEKKCTRNQFECRLTGECIAIYNACDGIPQCTDGSDEAPELDCPGTMTTSLPSHISNGAPPSPYNGNIPQTRLSSHQSSQVLSPPDNYRPPLNSAADVLRNTQIQPPPQNPDFIRPGDRTRMNINSRLVYDNQQMQPYGAGPILMPPNNWVPHQSNQLPPQITQYTDKNSHIFNHKENGLQVPNGQELSQVPYSVERGYGNIQNYYDNYRQPIQPEMWPVNQIEENQMNGYHQDNNRRNWPPPENTPIEPPKNSEESDKSKISENVNNNNNNNWKEATQKNPQHEQEKMAHELKHSKEKEKEVTIKIEKHKHSHHEQQYMDVAAYKMDGDLQDGVAETPGGAVLSLTLGLIITCIMALLIVCRLRVKKRMRKGGKSYAHDADFLVNGMYL